MTCVACRQDMHDQPRYKPLAVSEFFADGRSARPIPEGTVARDELDNTDSIHTGNANGHGVTVGLQPLTEFQVLLAVAVHHAGAEAFFHGAAMHLPNVAGHTFWAAGRGLHQ